MNKANYKKSKLVAKYVDFLPPCNEACPAGENIQKWIGMSINGYIEDAWRIIVQKNPFPSISGRVCCHKCESCCNRVRYDDAVNIHCMERFVGDVALDNGWKFGKNDNASGKKILIIGAGPAGLSAAYHLRKLGHDVTIYEELQKPGGMMFTGIPAYKLSREILFEEISRVLETGIEIKYNKKAEDVIFEKERGGFDAVFLAVGAHIGRALDIPSDGSCAHVSAASFLKTIAFGGVPAFGSSLVVYGGGNTSVDVAHSAARLGCSQVTIVYHRSKEKMQADQHEVKQAQESGVRFMFLRSLVAIKNGRLVFSVNDSTGSFIETRADLLVYAINQKPDTAFLKKTENISINEDNTVCVNHGFMTGHEGVFAGGDMIPGVRSVTDAVGHGRRAARYINAYLCGEEFTPHIKHDIASFERLNTNKNELLPKIQEKVGSKACTKEEFVYEAKRCFSCGNCFECDACYLVCPTKAIAKLSNEQGGRYKIDLDRCVGCAKCVRSCPCGAMIMTARQQEK